MARETGKKKDLLGVFTSSFKDNFELKPLITMYVVSNDG